MNSLMAFDLTFTGLVETAGLTLLVSAFPIMLVALLGKMTVHLFGDPRARYATGVSTLVLIAAIPISTALLLVKLESGFNSLASTANQNNEPIGNKAVNDDRETNPRELNKSDSNESALFDVNTLRLETAGPGVQDKNEVSVNESQSSPVVDEEIAATNEPTSAETNQVLRGVTVTALAWTKTHMSPWMPWVVAVWGLGFVAFFGRVWIGWRYSSYIARHGLSIDKTLQEKLNHICRKENIRRRVSIFMSELVQVPVVVGFFKSVILVPASTLTNLNSQELESILRHELAHIRRYDAVVNLLQMLLETTLFYHPAVWWVSRQVRMDRELCCDRWAAKNNGQAKTLARALLRLEESRAATPVMAATGGNLMTRIQRLLEFEKTSLAKKNRTGAVTLSLLTLLIACAAIGGWVAQSDRQQQNNLSVRSKETSDEKEIVDQGYDKLKVTIYQRDAETQQITIDDKRVIQAILEFFPQATTDRQGMRPAGYVVDYHLEFTGPDKKTIKIGLSTSLMLWSAGKGDWKFDSLNEFRKLLNQQVEKSDTQAEEIIEKLSDSIKALPTWQSKAAFRSAPYMKVAHLLQQLPIAKRKKVLNSWAKEYEEQLFILCRMLFEKKDDFRRPGLGGPMFVDGGKIADWPLEPITLVDRVPFVIVRGYVLGGRPESIKSYLQYCYDKCQWSERDYSQSDQDTLNAALGKLLADKKDQLGEYSTEFLSMQVAPQHLDWQLYGKVTDDEGNPLADVELRMATGMATLLGGGSAKTDKDGNYRLNFGEGIWSNEGPNMQVAWLFVSKPGYVYKSNSRKIDLSMAMSRQRLNAEQMPKTAWSNMRPNDLIVKNSPHKMNIVMSKPAEVLVRVFDNKGNRIKDSKISVDDTNQTSEATDVQFAEDEKPHVDLAMGLATNKQWTLSVPLEGRRRQKASPLLFKDPGRYEVEVVLLESGGAKTLEIQSVKKADGSEVSGEVIFQAGPSLRPLGEELTAKAISHIKEMAKKNKVWLKPGQQNEIKWEDLEFEIEQDGKTANVKGAVPNQLFPVFRTALHYLVEKPDEVIYRQLNENESGEIVISFSFKEPIRVSFGNGIQGKYHGFVQTNVHEGTLTIDGKTMTPKSLITNNSKVEFSDFIQIERGQFAPRTMKIVQPLACEWKFDVYQGGIWMLYSIDDGRLKVKKISQSGMPLEKIEK